MSTTTPDPDTDTRKGDPRLTLAEIGGALTNDDLKHAEQRTLKLLGQIRRQKQEGRR